MNIKPIKTETDDTKALQTVENLINMIRKLQKVLDISAEILIKPYRLRIT